MFKYISGNICKCSRTVGYVSNHHIKMIDVLVIALLAVIIESHKVICIIVDEPLDVVSLLNKLYLNKRSRM